LNSISFRFNLLIDLDVKADIFIFMARKTTSNPVLTFLFFALIGGAFFILWGKQFNFDFETEKELANEAVQETGEIYSLEPIVVELAGRYLKVEENENEGPPRIGTRKKYLGVTVNLELKNETMREDLEKKLPQIRDAVSEIVSSQKARDIKTAKGKDSLQVEIADRLNSILGEKGVSKVFFADFIIQ